MSLTIHALPLSTLIKNATQENHKETEALLIPKLSSIASAHEYAAILRMFYGFFYPVEQHILHYITPLHLSDIHERRKADALLQDLQALHYEKAQPVLCTKLPSITNVSAAFGAMYVLEGSTLGGKFIAKMLAKNKAVPSRALQFFSGYGEQTGSRWKNFLEVLNQQPEQEEVVAAANDTFYSLKCWMQQTLCHDRN